MMLDEGIHRIEKLEEVDLDSLADIQSLVVGDELRNHNAIEIKGRIKIRRARTRPH